MRPVQISSWNDWQAVYGNPIDGSGKPASVSTETRTGGKVDTWRLGNYVGPTYAGYAAESHLKAQVSPATGVRLLGMAPDGAATDAAKAGWYTQDSAGAASNPGATVSTNGGAWGLLVFDSGSNMLNELSASGGTTPVTGTLAAVFYLSEGYVNLSGSALRVDGTPQTSSIYQYIQSLTASGIGTVQNSFKLDFYDDSSDLYLSKVVNFDRTSTNYIRNVLNTNPMQTNGTLNSTANTAKYWVGQTYSSQLTTLGVGTNGPGTSFGALVCLSSGSTVGSAEGFHKMQSDFQYAKTGWIFSQDLDASYVNFDPADTSRCERLFRLCATDAGEYIQKNIKISISDIKAPTYTGGYGTFTVEVRTMGSPDSTIANSGRLEMFQNCNLDRNSVNFVGRVIGDRYHEYSKTNNPPRWMMYGKYPNRSQYIRVEMYSDRTPVAKGALPFGFEGPLTPKNFTVISASNEPLAIGAPRGDGYVYRSGSDTQNTDTMVQYFSKFSAIPGLNANQYDNRNRGFITMADKKASGAVSGGPTGSVFFPKIRLRTTNGMSGDICDTVNKAYYGFTPLKIGQPTLDPGVVDYLWPLPFGLQSNSWTAGDQSQVSLYFTLDDLSGSGDHTSTYNSGSRAAGTSLTAVSGGYTGSLEAGGKNFTLPLVGGFDGLRIQEAEPFNNTDLAGTTESSYYANYSIRAALNSVRDEEVVEANLITIPGLTDPTLTKEVIALAEERQDVLGLIDIEGGYTPDTENSSTAVTRRGNLKTALTKVKNRQLNSSWGCAYYPWLYITDGRSGATVDVPPSVAAVGAMALSDKEGAVWFAPAGFNRGGISGGKINLSVGGVKQQLNRDNRDDLYEVDINPIANFTQEGIVVFGQKTLLADLSALDRINVRRMLIYVKKQVRLIANGILFEQNVQDTWNKFNDQVSNFLRGVKSDFGIADYLVKLDDTTTTPDLIDQNVMYAKVYIKPARAIEFIALDFVITRSDVDFETL